MTKIQTYLEALALEALMRSKGINMNTKGFNFAVILALLSALGPVLAAGGPALDEAIKGLNVSLPILEQAGIIPAGIGTIIAQIVADYGTYAAGGPATIGPLEIPLFGAKDKVSLTIQKSA